MGGRWQQERGGRSNFGNWRDAREQTGIGIRWEVVMSGPPVARKTSLVSARQISPLYPPGTFQSMRTIDYTKRIKYTFICGESVGRKN